MYKRELDFLNQHLDLLDKNKFEELFNLAKNIDRTHHFWWNILDIFYDPDVNIDPLAGLSSIPDYYYFNYNGIQSITIPDSVTEIGEYAFSFCINLESVIISDSANRIDDCAFSGCRRLKSVIVPNSVITIGVDVFRGCKSLSSVTIPKRFEYELDDIGIDANSVNIKFI